ncbi:MAG: ABC transporter substrate-binding protein [Chloroflexi bacterium]|nr:ABC transporter substrate-binding protein [Chloroflexota bacterium]
MGILLLSFVMLVVPAQTQDAKEGGTLIFMNNTDVISWDQSRTTWPSIRAVRPLYDSLLTVDNNENLLPYLATSWEISEDGLEYTFRLREGVMFHDGTPWNAHAVIFNIQRIIDDPDARGNVRMSKVVEMEALDDYTAWIKIGEPNGDFIYDVAVGTDSYQISPTAWGEDGSAFHENPVGTGAFMFVSHEPQSEIQYVANPNYWQGAPLLDGLTIRVHGDNTVRLIEIESGNVHYIDGIDPDDIYRLQAETDLVTNAPIGPGVSMISINVSRYPMSELSLRYALAHAVDFDALIEEFQYGYATRSRGGVSPNSPYWTDDLPPVAPYDPERAAEILEEAGWALADDGFRYRDCNDRTVECVDGKERLVVHIISADVALWGLYNEIYQQYLLDIGVDAPIKSAEINAMLDEWRENQGNWTFGHHSQGSFFAVTSAIEAAWQPDAFWSIYQIDDATDPYLIEAAAELQEIGDAFSASTDLEERIKLSHRAQTIFLEQQLTIWGWHTPRFNVVSPIVEGVEFEMMGRIPLFHRAWLNE